MADLNIDFISIIQYLMVPRIYAEFLGTSIVIGIILPISLGTRQWGKIIKKFKTLSPLWSMYSWNVIDMCILNFILVPSMEKLDLISYQNIIFHVWIIAWFLYWEYLFLKKLLFPVQIWLLRRFKGCILSFYVSNL